MTISESSYWRLAVRWALCLFASLTPVFASAAETYNLGHQFPADSIPDRVARKFAELTHEYSQGDVAIKVHANAAFGDERGHVALLRRQALDFAITGDLVIGSLSDRYLVMNMPFLYRDLAHAMAVYDGKLGDAIRLELKTHGLRALSWHHVGTRMLTANRPIRNTTELAGLALRLPQDTTWIAAWRALGATPRQVAFTELASALQLGTVEAQENPPNFIRSSKLYLHQKYIMTTNHMPQRQFIFASEGRWSGLTAQQRNSLQKAAAEASRWAVSMANAEHAKDLAWLLDEGGMKLVTFDAAGVQNALRGVPALVGGTEGAELYQQLRAIPP